MTTEVIIKKVREELGKLDEHDKRIVAATLKVLERENKANPLKLSKQHFVGNNITLEKYKALSLDDKRCYHDEAEDLNKQWIEHQLKHHNAEWIMVVDGQVVLHGATLDEYPEDEEIINLCKRTGKYPFAFFNPAIFAIEEIPASWHLTKYIDDAYPALPIAVSEKSTRFETIADLDTGALGCFASLRLLEKKGVVEVKDAKIVRTAKHLSQPYVYFAFPLWLELTDDAGTTRRQRITVVCVDDWDNSPFTSINPDRTLLVGRRTLLKLRPRIVLDFDTRMTEVAYKETTS